MDQQAHQEIAAATAAHRELGPGYDDAVAEGLVERIGAEIDKRVDARLAQRGDGPVQHAPGSQVSPAAHPPWPAIGLALGSMMMGVFAAAAVLNSGGSGGVVALVWVIIGVINVAYARRH